MSRRRRRRRKCGKRENSGNRIVGRLLWWIVGWMDGENGKTLVASFGGEFVLHAYKRRLRRWRPLAIDYNNGNVRRYDPLPTLAGCLDGYRAANWGTCLECEGAECGGSGSSSSRGGN